jgi:transketolase
MKLGNLIVFLDHNNLQIDGSVEDINSLSSPSERWRAFGWNTQEIDGHDLQAINEAVERAKDARIALT